MRVWQKTLQKRNAPLGAFRFLLVVNQNAISVMSELQGLGVEILLNHERNLEGDCVLKFTKVKTCNLSDFFKSVHESVSVNKELS
jgi:hypothetical protein